ESHSRYLISVNPKNIKKTKDLLEQKGVSYGMVGKFSGSNILFKKMTKTIVNLRVDKAQKKWLNSLGLLVAHG
ncbi:MAG: hypothetical protein WD884_05445, partial [Nitrosopumilaceae archaeon]